MTKTKVEACEQKNLKWLCVECGCLYRPSLLHCCCQSIL